jgi:hypothetical protein
MDYHSGNINCAFLRSPDAQRVFRSKGCEPASAQ